MSLCGFLALAASPYAGPRSIVPGRGIGHVHLGEQMDEVYRTLKGSTSSEGAMEHGLDVWHTGDGNELDVTSVVDHHGQGPGRIVLQIRVTSPYFVTADGSSTRSGFGPIWRAFPEARLVATYASRDAHRTLFVYDDKNLGIAFEVSARSSPAAHCVAIVVHPAGRAVTDEYLPVEPYRQTGG